MSAGCCEGCGGAGRRPRPAFRLDGIDCPEGDYDCERCEGTGQIPICDCGNPDCPCGTCHGARCVEVETWHDARALDPGYRTVPCPECAPEPAEPRPAGPVQLDLLGAMRGART